MLSLNDWYKIFLKLGKSQLTESLGILACYKPHFKQSFFWLWNIYHALVRIFTFGRTHSKRKKLVCLLEHHRHLQISWFIPTYSARAQSCMYCVPLPFFSNYWRSYICPSESSSLTCISLDIILFRLLRHRWLLRCDNCRIVAGR